MGIMPSEAVNSVGKTGSMTLAAKFGIWLFVCGVVLLVYWLLSPPVKPFSVIGLAMVCLCLGARLARNELLRPVRQLCDQYHLNKFQLTEKDAMLLSPAASALLGLFLAAALLKAPIGGPFALIGVGLLVLSGGITVLGAYHALVRLKETKVAWLTLLIYCAIFGEVTYWWDKLRF